MWRGDRPAAVPSPLFAFTRSGAWLAGVEVDGWSAYSAACGIPSTAFWRRAVPAALPETPASGRSSCGIQRNTSHRCFDREAYSDHSNPDAAFVRSWVQYMLLFYAAPPCLCKNLVKLLGNGAGDDRKQIEVQRSGSTLEIRRELTDDAFLCVSIKKCGRKANFATTCDNPTL